MPEGKGSWSMLIIWRLSGMATITPRKEMAPIQTASSTLPSLVPLSSRSAGIALTRPAELMVPAAEAADCMALFSRSVKWPPGRIFSKILKMAKARMPDVMVTPKPQPVSRPTYRLDTDITAPRIMPMITARIVSCLTSPR
ncbi:hypothetical protein D3C72_814760 [compost metagenome]